MLYALWLVMKCSFFKKNHSMNSACLVNKMQNISNGGYILL